MLVSLISEYVYELETLYGLVGVTSKREHVIKLWDGFRREMQRELHRVKLEAAPHSKEKKPSEGGNNGNGNGNNGTTRTVLKMVDLHHQVIPQVITRLHRHPKGAQAISLPMEGVTEEVASLLHHPVLAVKYLTARKQN